MNAGYVRFRQAIDGFLAQRPAICQYLFHFVIGLAAGRSILGGLAPFSTALAVVSPFLPERPAWPLLGGLLLGIFTRGDAYSLINPLGDALTAVAAAFLTLRLQKSGSRVPLATLPVTAGGINLLIKTGLHLFLKKSTGVFPGLLSESVLAGLFTLPFYYVLTDFRLEKKEFARPLLLLFLVLCGLGNLRIGPVEIREVLVRGLLLLIAAGWGAPWGAAAGVLLGLLVGDLWQMLPRIGFYAGTGFCSGILKNLGRTGVLFGFVLAGLLFSFFYETQVTLAGHLIASGFAAGLYLLCSPFLERLLGKDKPKLPGKLAQLQAEIGFSQRAKPAEPLCGDSLAIAHLDLQRLLLIVSDGMGAGINAARESRIVIKMMEQLIGNGNPPEVAAGVVNTGLYLRGGEESAATIDLALIDLSARSVDFLKAGAPPSFIKRNDSVEMVRSACWPAGILDRLETEVLRREILPGDILVMVTDGITEAEQEGTAPGGWLYSFLQEIPVEEPQVVADLILKRALKNGGSQNRDDMTVLVARFCGECEVG